MPEYACTTYQRLPLGSKRGTFDSAARQRVLQHAQVNLLLTRFRAQLGQIANRDPTILSKNDALGFRDLRGNLSDDGLLAFFIEWHG